MSSGTGKTRLAKQHKIQSSADKLTKDTHFNYEECKVLLYIYEKLAEYGSLDRLRMREVLHITFNITDDVMLDLVYRAFDRDNNGVVDEAEWVRGLSIMLRGEVDQLIDFCYFVYDMNGDGSLAREELTHCLRGCIISGYGIDSDELDECERDIVEICMKKLDVDHDGQITFPDFQNAVYKDPLLLQAIGPCLPAPNSIAAFLSLVTFHYRKYTDCYGRGWVRSDRKSSRGKSLRNYLTENIKNAAGMVDSLTTTSLTIARKSKSFSAIHPKN